MKKVLCLAIALVFLFVATSAKAEPRVIPRDDMSREEAVLSEALIQKLLFIREAMQKTDRPMFYLHIDVLDSTMTVYRLMEEFDGEISLEELSTHLVGTPKAKKYPKGFGYISSIEKAPSWAPTPETVKEFKKRGINLEKFRSAQGKIIVPPGHPLNYMGPVKMRVKFLEKQANAKLNRDVYRIHGTLKKDVPKLGTRCSGGCIRTLNEELLELNEQMKGGFIIVEYV